MRTALENIEKIDLYLNGELSIEELTIFEQEISANIELKALVEEQKLVITAIKRKALRKEIHKASNSGYGKIALIGGIIVLLLVAFYLLSGNKVVEKVTPIASDTIASVITADTLNTIEEENISEIIPQKNDFHGLDTWARPDVQNFTFKPSDGATIEGKDGTLIIVPTNGIIDNNNEPIKGDIEFELVEALMLDDMVLYNLTTMADDKLLETGGMVFVNATQNGKQLKVNPKRPLYIEIPTNEVQPEMMAFKGEVTSEGNINWKEPKSLQKYLVKVDFENLDFLPQGFEQAFHEERPSSKFYTHDRQVIDSMYYSLGFNQENQIKIIEAEEDIDNVEISESEWGTDYTSSEIASMITSDNVPTEKTATIKDELCGVDPLTIKTIRTTEFQNTYIATKEFEERLKYIHSLDNGQQIIDIYINNLGKQLWEVDEMVALKISGDHQIKFKEFANMKLTNIKDANIYQERLSNYYNTKRQESQEALSTLKAELRNKDQKELNKLIKELNALREKANNDFNKNLQSKIKNQTRSKGIVNSVANTNSYAFQWASFGWANIDQYLHLLSKGSMAVNIEVKNPSSNLKVYQWLNTISTLTPLLMNKNTCEARFPKKGSKGASAMKNTYSIAISRKGDQFYWTKKNFNPYKTNIVDLELEPATLKEIKAKLAALSSKNEPLIKSLKTAKEEIEIEQKRRNKALKKMEDYNKTLKQFESQYTLKKEQEVAKFKLAQQQKENFMYKLRSICFPCSITNEVSSFSTSNEAPIFSRVDEMPYWASCEGSTNRKECSEREMMSFLYSNIRYPEVAKQNNTLGVVYIGFEIDQKGKVKNPKILRGIGDGCDEEAIRVVNLFPDFIPGKQAGKPARVSYNLPVRFSLN